MVPVVISVSTIQGTPARGTSVTVSSNGFTDASAAPTGGIPEPGGCHGDE